jgi:predicted transposase YdaD
MDINVNLKHKDSVFSKLFSSPEILRELYSAIEGIDVPKDAIVDINTLSEALFMKRINDLSFTIDDRIVVLIEHQSTINENIPLRVLMYIARVYEKIIESKNIYHKKLIKIPTPEFIVLYNGKEECPDHYELRLSSAFKDITGLKWTENDWFPLELIVQVYNINQGRNPQILQRSENLNGYSFFIGKVNEYKEYLTLEESVRSAVKYCIEHGILKDFLEKHGSEVVNMLFDDISVEEIAEIRAEEAREEGFEQGLGRGRKEGLEKLRAEKITIARNLLAKGSTLEFVSEITGLSEDEIAKL